MNDSGLDQQIKHRLTKLNFRIFFDQQSRQPQLRIFLPMHQPDLCGFSSYAVDKPQQVLLIGIGEVAVEGIDTRLN